MMLRLIKLVFVAILSFRNPLATQNIKCISLDTQICVATPTLIDLNPDELGYYPFMANLDRCGWSFNALDDTSAMIFDLSDRLTVPNKTKVVDLNVLNMITWFNESKSLGKRISRGFRRR